jgi:ketosteroid isomerase-like protein
LLHHGVGIGLIWLALTATPVLAQTDDRQVDHEAIIQTREIALDALNTRDFDKVKPYLHPEFTISTVDNQIFHSLDAFEKYWTDQLSGPIESIQMSVSVDAPTTFLSEQTGVAYGDADATFTFTDGNVRVMAMRWTAVMQKVADTWTIHSLHFSANLLDNPVLKASQQLGRIWAIGTGIGGLLLGGIVLLIFRPKSA